MTKLDIIVTHYDEPWEVGEKFFEMLGLQRSIDFSEIRILLMHDGSKAFPQEYFHRFPYIVDQYELEHGGVSAARNEGIRLSKSEWISFSDFDDMYAGAYSLHHVLSLLPADGYDILWGDFYSEDRTNDGETILHRRKLNSVFIHAKYFRKSFLTENDLWFPEDLIFNEDSCFCTIAYAVCDYKRIGQIKAEMPLYVWMYREGSATATKGSRVKALTGLYQRNKKVLEAFRTHLNRERYLTMLCRTCFDAYHTLCLKQMPEELKPVEDDFRKFWADHRNEYSECPKDLRREAMEASRREHDHGDMEEAKRWGRIGDPEFDRSRNFVQWIREIEGKEKVAEATEGVV